MCGIWYSNQVQPGFYNMLNVNRRGPDNFKKIKHDLGYFAHSMLVTKPPFYEQPAVTKHGVLLYNGSIHNVKGNDTNWIVNNLSQHLDDNLQLIKTFQGEYALVFVSEQHIIFCTDHFSMRNLWYYYDSDKKVFSASSSPDVLRKQYGRCWPCYENTIYVLSKSTWEIKKFTNEEWDLKQYVDSYDNLFETFEQVVLSRYSSQSKIMLSSGYDSGVIACAYDKHNVSVEALIFRGSENQDILTQRCERLANFEILQESKRPQKESDDLHLLNNQPELDTASGHKLSLLYKQLRDDKYKTLIGGHGGDELYADYRNEEEWTNECGRFNGVYPEDLSLVWPWHKNWANLLKNTVRIDMISGYHGTEASSPLLDKKVVQSWLNVTLRLKNRSARDWMKIYFEENKYPYDLKGKTIGFNYHPV